MVGDRDSLDGGGCNHGLNRVGYNADRAGVLCTHFYYYTIIA